MRPLFGLNFKSFSEHFAKQKTSGNRNMQVVLYHYFQLSWELISFSYLWSKQNFLLSN